jgi:hypothetical protein
MVEIAWRRCRSSVMFARVGNTCNDVFAVVDIGLVVRRNEPLTRVGNNGCAFRPYPPSLSLEWGTAKLYGEAERAVALEDDLESTVIPNESALDLYQVLFNGEEVMRFVVVMVPCAWCCSSVLAWLCERGRM